MFKNKIQNLAFLFVLVLGLSSSVNALVVTVSIPPLAGMIAPLLSDEDELYVLLKPGVSPHGFQLRPSHLRKIQNSDLVLSVGSAVDAWIQKPIQSMNKTNLSMNTIPRVTLLPLRQGGLWDLNDQHTHLHEHHNGEPEEKATVDGHLWMSVENVLVTIEAVSQQLKILQPEKAKAIELRTSRWLAKINLADQDIMSLLAPVKHLPYLVLHDAFQYFEKHYQLNGVGSIRLNPEIPPSLKRIHQLRQRIETGNVTCVFKEPQFSEKRLMSVTSGLKLKVGMLDPMGSLYIKNKPYLLYEEFLRLMAKQFLNCLSDKG